MTGGEIRLGLPQFARIVKTEGFVVPPEIPVRLTTWVAAFWLITRSGIKSIVGGASAGLTVTVKDRITVLLIVPPSSTITVIIAVPNDPAAGLKLKVPLVPGLV